MISTCGVWMVKAGHEDEFVRHWERSAGALSLDFPNLTFQLFRDHAEPRRYVSMGTGWRNVEEVEAARALPSFVEAVSAIEPLLDSGDIATLDLVVEVS